MLDRARFVVFRVSDGVQKRVRTERAGFLNRIQQLDGMARETVAVQLVSKNDSVERGKVARIERARPIPGEPGELGDAGAGRGAEARINLKRFCEVIDDEPGGAMGIARVRVHECDAVGETRGLFRARDPSCRQIAQQRLHGIHPV